MPSPPLKHYLTLPRAWHFTRSKLHQGKFHPRVSKLEVARSRPGTAVVSRWFPCRRGSQATSGGAIPVRPASTISNERKETSRPGIEATWCMCTFELSGHPSRDEVEAKFPSRRDAERERERERRARQQSVVRSFVASRRRHPTDKTVPLVQ